MTHFWGHSGLSYPPRAFQDRGGGPIFQDSALRPPPTAVPLDRVLAWTTKKSMESDTIAPGLEAELAAACAAARAAGQAAMRFYGSARATEKEGGSPVTEADQVAN